jgi:DNA-binding MarR family transcriptional regulator
VTTSEPSPDAELPPRSRRPAQPPDLAQGLSEVLPDIDVTSALLLMRAGRLGRLVERHRGRLAQLNTGLDATSQAVLGALLMLGPPHRLTPTFLGRYVLQTSGGMTKTLRRLQDDGLVERVPDERDRRVSYVQLTEKGRALTTRTLSALVQEWDDALRAADVDVDEAMAMVTTLLEILERLTGSHLGRTLGV